MMDCRRFAISVATLLLATSSAVAQGKGDSAFRDGLEARADNKWPDVVRRMRDAIAADGTESTRTVTFGGMNFGVVRAGRSSMEYLPHFFLGEALYRTGRCADAVSEWDISEKQRVVATRSDFVTVIHDGYMDCRRKGVLAPGEFEAAVANVDTALREAGAAAQDVIDRSQGQPDYWKPAQRSQYEQERARVVAATQKF